MNKSNTLQRSPETDDLSERLAEQTPLILDRWEEQVRRELPASRQQDAPLLRDHLPVFLLQLAHVLSPLTPGEDACTPSEVCKQHGRERAWTREYSLDQVLREYSVLRSIILEVLEAEGPVLLEERQYVHRCIDGAMEEAGTEFARIHQEALRRSEEQYRLLVEGVQDYALFLMDPEGRFVIWNAGAERLTGYREEEAVGQPFSLLFNPEDIEAGVPEQELECARAQGKGDDTRWHVRKDGTRYWAVGTTRPLFDDTGNLRGFAKVMGNLTDRKRLEDQLQQQAEQLAEADQRKNEFLAMLAHEMRTPISAISNALCILENIELADERGLRQLGAASRQTRQLARLAEDLLDVARIVQGKADLRRQTIDLVQVAGNAAQSSLPFLEARGQELTTSFPPEPLWMNADPVRLEQVFTNLLNNAAKYTEAGGRVWLTVDSEGDQAVVRVRDTGIGIEPVMLPQIFDLFIQVDSARTHSRGGLGIGLTLVRRLVEMHGGSVTAHSSGPSQGTEFVVRLPLASGGALGQ